MKRILFYLALLSSVLLCACNGQKQKGTTTETQTTEPTDTIAIMVMQIRKSNKLHTAEYLVRKIVTHNDEKTLQGSILKHEFNISIPLSSRKIAIPMEATLKAYVDFSDFSEENIKRYGEHIEIILPDPKVEMTSSRISHEEIKRHVAWIRSDFTDAELSNYEKQGRTSIINSIPKLGIIDMAKENAAHMLIPIIMQMGYKEENITVTFRKEFTIGDLPMLLDNGNTEQHGRIQQ